MQRRARGEGTVYEETDPRRSTTHRAEMYVELPDGRVKRILARGHSRSDALRKVHKAAARARDVLPSSDRLRLSEYLDSWLEYKREHVRASTLAAYENDVAHIVEHLGHKRLGRLRAYDIQRMLSKVQHAKPKGSKGMRAQADKIRRTIKQALRQAVRWELLPRNPVEQLDPVRHATVERRTWTPAEIEKFLRAARKSPYYPLFVAALFTGARAGELLALEWRDVKDDRFYIRRTWSRHADDQVESTKTAAGVRSIPVSQFVLDSLGRRGQPHELVFGSRRGTHVNPANVRRALHLYAGRAKVPAIRFHELRRTYATTLARLGHHPRVIQHLLGHATPHLAMTVYTDVMAEQETAARLEPHDVMHGGSSGGNTNATPAAQRVHSEGRMIEGEADEDDENPVLDGGES